MPLTRPFRGWRYASGSALSRRLCPPYDVIKPEAARALRRDRANAVRLELPEGEGARRYAEAAALWARWRRDGTLRRDGRPAFYLIEERFRLGGKALVRRGLLAALSARGGGGRVIPHERTLAKPKADRLRMLRTLGANISPVFGVVADPGGALARRLARLARGKAAARAAAGGVSYRLLVLDEPALVAELSRELKPRECLIADGHHRFSVAQENARSARSPGAGSALAYLVSDADPGLAVLPTHRISAAGLLDRAGRLARLSPRPSLDALLGALSRTDDPYAFGLIEGGAFLLGRPRSRGGCRSGLGVEWAGRFLLEEIAPEELSYTPDAREAARRAAERGAAVLIKPFSAPAVRAAAKAAGLLPQKSTYFFPKIAAGLAFRGLDER